MSMHLMRYKPGSLVYAKDTQAIKECLVHRANVDEQDRTYLQTALILAATCSDYSKAEFLLKWKANPNVQDCFGNTALIKAAIEGNITMCELLLHAGSDQALKRQDGKTALQLATFIGHQAVASYLESWTSDTDMAVESVSSTSWFVFTGVFRTAKKTTRCMIG